MHLLSFRVIGHPDLPDSSWLEVGSGLNILKTGKSGQAEILFRALQTINPPDDLRQKDPLADFSPFTSVHQYSRRVIPAKKTAALAIFAASPLIVRELAAINPIFYETNRIELGRRRDYSRWINFVELPASSRWSEIEPLISSLLSHVGAADANAVEPLQTTMATLHATDRIDGEVAIQLHEQLHKLRRHLPAAQQSVMDQCSRSIDRAHHFRQAKEALAARLPLFLALAATTGPSDHGSDTGAELLTLLTARLLYNHSDQASFADRLQQINLQLQPIYPELNLLFRVQGEQILLESATKSTPQPITLLPPVVRLKALLAGLAALHAARIGCQPIFLLDIQKMKLPQEQQVDLLDALRRCASRWQCLVIPDHTFLTLCMTEAAITEPATMTLLELG